MPFASYDVGNGSRDQLTTSKRPDNTAFKQQKLPAWQPILTPKSVLPTFYLVALIFIPIGIVLLVVSDGVVEATTDYTDCPSLHQVDTPCSAFRLQTSAMEESCYCNVTISVPARMGGNIFMYYGLSNFYQNHRRYVKSRDDDQLVGEHVTASTISPDCSPYRTKDTNTSTPIPIAPCGAIANSLFNDSFEFIDTAEPVFIDNTQIAWTTDHNVKFNNPSPTDNLTVAFNSTLYAKPYFWNESVIDLDKNNIDNNGYKNEAFEVWMRTAAFPTFRKLYGRLNVTLEPGDYHIKVSYNYPVTEFRGRKQIILSTTSFMGGKNSFLGIMYIVVGGLSLVVAIALSVIACMTKNGSSSN